MGKPLGSAARKLLISKGIVAYAKNLVKKKDHIYIRRCGLARLKGLEPLISRFVAVHSIQLSYRRISWCSNILPHLREKSKTFFRIFINFLCAIAVEPFSLTKTGFTAKMKLYYKHYGFLCQHGGPEYEGI